MGRIKRTNLPPKAVKARRYRADSLPYLLKDFSKRCAYSGQHLNRAGGLKCMEVDHFDPRSKHSAIQEYSNLFLATRHCNGRKGDNWPSSKERHLGVRFIDPCAEFDYGKHIFEDPSSCKLWSNTPPGRYQIRMCDLNAPHLVEERMSRRRIWTQLKADASIKIARSADFLKIKDIIKALRSQAEEMIPLWPEKSVPSGFKFIE